VGNGRRDPVPNVVLCNLRDRPAAQSQENVTAELRERVAIFTAYPAMVGVPDVPGGVA
jgi:hypothetical protein